MQCATCKGRGNVWRGDGRGTCGVCGGTGRVRAFIPDSDGCLATIASYLLMAVVWICLLVALYLWLQWRGEIP